MAVGFYSGTSTGPNDLIDKLRLAAIAESWTIDAFTAVGAGYRLHMHKTLGGEVSYFNIRSAIAEYGTTLITEDNYDSSPLGLVTGLIVNGSTGYDAGELWHVQPGYPQHAYSSNHSYGNCMSPMSISAIPAYYFFFVGNSIHIAVEITSGKFQFMSFGMLSKQGVYTGGQYFTASMTSRQAYGDYNVVTYGTYRTSPHYFASNVETINGAVYVTADEVTSWRIAGSWSTYNEILFSCPSGQYTTLTNTWTHEGIASFFYSKSPNDYNAMSAMCPIYTFLKRSDGNFSLLGWPEGVRFLNVTNYTPGQEIIYGAETWIVFPSNGVNFEQAYPYAGFAFLKDDGS